MNDNILTTIILTELSNQALRYKRDLELLINDKTTTTEELSPKILDVLNKLAINDISTRYWMSLNNLGDITNQSISEMTQ